MGNLQATEMASMTDIYTGIRWHLRHNHYPPVPEEMVQVAVSAIDSINAGYPEMTVRTPFEHRRYGFNVPAWAIVESLHLEPWIEKEA